MQPQQIKTIEHSSLTKADWKTKYKRKQSDKEVNMANEQIPTNAQTVDKAARVAIQTMSTASAARTEHVGSRMSVPIMKQPTFDWNFRQVYGVKKLQTRGKETCSKTSI